MSNSILPKQVEELKNETTSNKSLKKELNENPCYILYQHDLKLKQQNETCLAFHIIS